MWSNQLQQGDKLALLWLKDTHATIDRKLKTSMVDISKDISQDPPCHILMGDTTTKNTVQEHDPTFAYCPQNQLVNKGHIDNLVTELLTSSKVTTWVVNLVLGNNICLECPKRLLSFLLIVVLSLLCWYITDFFFLKFNFSIMTCHHSLEYSIKFLLLVVLI